MTINKVLECIIDKYTLSESKFEQLEKSYNAISNWIANGVEFKEIYDVELRPQGSIALGTAILPVSKDDEVDVDLLCIIKNSKLDQNPKKMKHIVGDRLRENALYNKNIKEGKRCWTIDYSGYHLDVLPCVDNPGANDLIATHTENYVQYVTTRTNPIEYRKWFFNIANKRVFMEDAKIIELQRVKRRNDLLKIVQLLKLNRDFWIKKNNIDPEDKPISIIITTLAANAYNCYEYSLLDKFINVVLHMRDSIRYDNIGVKYVFNPVDQKENFADKWQKEPQREYIFFKWLEQLESVVKNLNDKLNYYESSAILKELFGDIVVNEAYNAIGDNLQDMRNKSKLYCDSKGIINEEYHGKIIEPHTFYGVDD